MKEMSPLLCFMAPTGSLFVYSRCPGVSPIRQEGRVKKNRVRELWQQGQPAVEGWCSTGNPYIAEMMGHAGFDAVVIDWQHGVGVSQESVVACIQALGSSDAVPIVRLPRNSPEYISYVLDAGAYGVIVPMVNTYEEAEAAGRACRYAPCAASAKLTGHASLGTAYGQ
jgi:2-keto-3-deoxy-L-rhamnonate aldolase RhmA